MDDREYNLEYLRYRQEWWKSGISVFMAVSVAFLGYSVQSSLNQQKAELDKQQSVITAKREIYASLGKNINDIYIFCADVGDFSVFDPPKIIRLKRDTDRMFYTYKAYWSDSTIEAFDIFENAAFKHFRGSGVPAGIRGFPAEKIAVYKQENKTWDPEWNGYFTNERDERLQQKYNALVEAMLEDAADYRLHTHKIDK